MCVWREIHRFEDLSWNDHAGSRLVASQIFVLIVEGFGAAGGGAILKVVDNAILFVSVGRHVRLIAR